MILHSVSRGERWYGFMATGLLLALATGSGASAQYVAPYVYWEPPPNLYRPVAVPVPRDSYFDLRIDEQAALAEGLPLIRDQYVTVHSVIPQNLARLTADAHLTKKITLPAGSILTRLTPVDPKHSEVWCDLTVPQKSGTRRYCIEVGQNAEGLDLYMSWTGFHDPLGIGAPAALEKIRFEPHTSGPVPKFTLGMAWCDGDGVTGPYRFQFAMKQAEVADWPKSNLNRCRNGTWPDPGNRNLIDVAGLRIEVTPAVDKHPASFRMLQKLSRRELYHTLGMILPPELRDGDPAISGEAGKAQSSKFADPVPDSRTIKIIGTAPLVPAEPIHSGKAVFSVNVRYSFQGRLSNLVSPKKSDRGAALPVGSPVYGIPMSGQTVSGLVWCAPRQQADPKLGLRWESICLPEFSGTHSWVRAEKVMLNSEIAWSGMGWFSKGSEASPPAVGRAEQALPDLVLSYDFLDWSATGSARIGFKICWPSICETFKTYELPPGADGLVRLKTLGGAVGLSPLEGETAMPGKGVRATILQPFDTSKPLTY